MRIIPAAAVAIVALSSAAHAQGYKRDIPDSLARKAAIAESAALAAAQKRVPKGKVESVELESEGGKLLYSVVLKVAGKSGVEEVNVDAMTGKVLTHEHETPAMEKKEAAGEKPLKVKKP
jgi:uncharacterized membrane protein YkoI